VLGPLLGLRRGGAQRAHDHHAIAAALRERGFRLRGAEAARGSTPHAILTEAPSSGDFDQ